MASPTPIAIRRLRLDFPADLDPMVFAGQPEESYGCIALSLLLPYLEPYLIRSMNAAKKHVTDEKLAHDIAQFNGQEGQHYRQHTRFNEAIRRQGFPQLSGLEEELAADYRRFSEKRSLRFNLAYAEGFEAYTTAMARFAFETQMNQRLHPAVAALFEWHLVEELEHRTVAFDVYAHVCGGYFYRLFVGLFAQWHLNRFVGRVIKQMVRADPEGFRTKYGGAFRAFRRKAVLLKRLARHFLPKVVATYSPWYTPHKIALSADIQAATARYTGLAAAGGANFGEPT